MNILKRCALLGWIAIVVLPACAHQIALKNGSIIQFDKYRVTEQSLLYTDGTGKEVTVPLSDIDYDHTRTLNATDTQPLNLPGMAIPNSPAITKTEPSLADIARQAQQGKTKATAKHVFTDDDFPSTKFPSTKSNAEAPISQTKTAERPSDDPEQFRDLGPEDLGSAILKMANVDVPFPDRVRWEQRLFDAKQAVLDQVNRMEGHKDANLDIQRQEIQKSQEATTNFKIIAGEGIQKAQAESDPKLKVHLQYEEWASQCSQYSSSVQTVGPNAGVNASEECYAGLENFKAQMQQEGTW